jgi:cytochrome P450
VALSYDPFDPATRADPYPYYAALREEAPVYWAEGVGGWVISRYDDVRRVLKDAGQFSSDAMYSMLMGSRPGQAPEENPELLERISNFARVMPALGPSRNLITTDPPHHDALRSLVNRGFSPRRIADWEPRVREIVAECWRRVEHRSEFDLIEDIAVPVPVVVIAEMLGVEREREADFKRWSDLIIAGVTGSGRLTDKSAFYRAMGELSHYILEVAQERKRAPQDDLVSVVVQAEEDGSAGLTAGDVVQLVLLLLVAGNETTTNLIGNAAHALLRHPDQLERARREPERIPALVEEVLRWDAPIQFVFRRATRDVEICGQKIRENDGVVALIGAANRDERQFEDAERFDITREASGHLAFGFGVHFCLGASLARLEGRAVLEALVPTLATLRQRDETVEYVDSFLIRGPRHLHLSRTA